MAKKHWLVEGVHLGKPTSELPITYLLWFVGSYHMRRTRWKYCLDALKEIKRRLEEDLGKVESDLFETLRPKPSHERIAIKIRRKAYRDGNKLIL